MLSGQRRHCMLDGLGRPHRLAIIAPMPPAPGECSGRSGRVAYAILAHSDQAQLLRLIRVLRTESPTCSVILHWDASKDPLDARPLEELGDVHLISDRVTVEWGGFSLVEATVRLMREALERSDCDWIVLLSGHDYPLRPLTEIEADLRDARLDAYIDVRQVVPDAAGLRWSRTHDGWLSRRYHFVYVPLPRLRLQLPAPIPAVMAKLAFLISKLQPVIMVWPMPAGARWRIGIRRPASPFGPDRPCRWGSQWMTLSRRAASRVLQRLTEERELVEHFKHTVIPDEAFFQTIICAERDLVVAGDNRRYEKWSGTASSHPEVLGRGDVDALLRSRRDFARKFLEAADASVLDEIDRHRQSDGRAAREAPVTRGVA